MTFVYHIVTIRVNETSWAHVWRIRFRYLGTGYDTDQSWLALPVVAGALSQPTSMSASPPSPLPPATCPQPTDKRSTQGNPTNPNSSFPRATTSEDPGEGSVSPTVTFQDGLELVPLEDLKDKAARPDAPTG
jgi:hypothetical protein